MRREIRETKSRARHYNAIAQCNIQLLTLEQRKLTRRFQQQLAKSEHIIIEHLQVKCNLEEKRNVANSKRREYNSFIRNIHDKEFDDFIFKKDKRKFTQSAPVSKSIERKKSKLPSISPIFYH